MTPKDLEGLAALIAVVVGLYCGRVWPAAIGGGIVGLCNAALLFAPLFQRVGIDRFLEMHAGNFVGYAGLRAMELSIIALVAHLLRRGIASIARLFRRRHRPPIQEENQDGATSASVKSDE